MTTEERRERTADVLRNVIDRDEDYLDVKGLIEVLEAYAGRYPIGYLSIDEVKRRGIAERGWTDGAALDLHVTDYCRTWENRVADAGQNEVIDAALERAKELIIKVVLDAVE